LYDPDIHAVTIAATQPKRIYASTAREMSVGDDLGESWEILPLLAQTNAPMWGLATHPADANRIVVFRLFGGVYTSKDAGESWRKIACEFGELTAAARVPN